MRKIIMVTHCFDKPLPAWFPLWAKACSYNEDVFFVVYTDSVHTGIKTVYGNVLIVGMSMEDFIINIERFTETHFARPIVSGYKICDLRPLFGEGIKFDGFDFWGHCDLDMFFGNVRKFITNSVLDNYDIISGHSGRNYGPFTLYRNVAEINNLWRENPLFEKARTSITNTMFDESPPTNKKSVSIWREALNPPDKPDAVYVNHYRLGGVYCNSKEYAFYHFTPYKDILINVAMSTDCWKMEKNVISEDASHA